MAGLRCRKGVDSRSAAEDQYRAALEAMADMLYVVDSDMRVRIVNEGCRLWMRQHGLNPNVVGLSLGEAFPFLSPSEHDEYDLVLSSGRPHVKEGTVRIKDRQYFAEVRKMPVRHNGVVTGVITIVRDITEQRRGEELLTESESRFRQLVEDAQDIIYRMSIPEGKYEYISPACRDITGYAPADHYDNPLLIGKLIHPDWADYFSHHWEELKAGRALASYEYQIVHRSGAAKWLYQRNALIRDEKGRPIAIEGIVTDITEKKETEAALRESEERYRIAIEQSNDGVKILQDEKYLFVNRKLVEMFRYDSADEIIGRPIGTLVDPDDRNRVFDINRRRARAEPVPSRYEVRHLRKDGTSFDAELSVAPISYKGRPALLVYVRDITERKCIEQALRESEAKYRNIFENSMEGIYQVAPEGRFITANPAAGRILGYKSPEELIKGITDIDSQIYAYPEDRERAMRLLRENGFIKDFEVRCRHKDGSIVWTSFNARLVRDKEGNLLYHEGTSRDITDRKRLEEELEKHRSHLEALVAERTDEIGRKEELYRTLVETIAEWIWETDHRGRYTYASPRVTDILGYRPEELLGKKPIDFMPPEEAKRADRLFRRFFRQRKAISSFESAGRHKDGHLVYRETNGIPFFGKDGKVLGYRGSDRDITERKKIFDELKQRKEELENTSASLQELNTALKVLLQQREQDKGALERAILSNARRLVMPYIEKLGAGRLTESQRLTLDVLKANLQEITSPFLQELTLRHFHFTARELEVVNLIKAGKTTKEIASLLRVGKTAVDSYRNHIRRKLGLSNQKVNLQSYLASLL